MYKKYACFKPIGTLQNRVLHQLHQRVNAQALLTQRIKVSLPDALAKQVAHCVAKDTKLLLYTSSANWASQLRFYSDAIVKAAGGAITTLQVNVLIKPVTSATKRRAAILPSTESIEFIKLYSDAIQDKQLKASLTRLSNTLTRLTSR